MGLLRLLLLSGLMLFSTLIASFAPLYFEMSPRKVNLISTYSTGLLVGAALTVVIPEGVAAVYGSVPTSDHHSHSHEEGVSSWIGASLLAGFILMYTIDLIHSHEDPYSTSRNRSHSNSPPSLRHMPSHLSELEPLSPPRTSTDSSAEQGGPATTDWRIPVDSSAPSDRPLLQHYRRDSRPPAPNSGFATLLGLLLHSLSDGISLGASTLSSNGDTDSSSSASLSSVIFLAIMLHKAPTAFALSNLLTSSVTSSKSFVKRGLILFSLSAPVGAIATYLLLLLGVGTDAGRGLEWYTGLTLVFSGGTFLFVATSHVTNEKAEGTDGDEGQPSRETISKRLRLGLVLAGMVTPGILGQLVGHGH